MNRLLSMPGREFVLTAFVLAALLYDALAPMGHIALLVIVVIGSIPTLIHAGESLWKREIGIDTFNIFALAVSFFTGELRSAAFIVLMLSFARLLDWKTSSSTQTAVESLLRLKPASVSREGKNGIEEVATSELRVNDIIVIKEHTRIPVDGIVVHGEGSIDESSVTGESIPKDMVIGDHLISSTLLISGFLKMRALRVGKDSTIERMIALMKEAVQNKSHPEKLADRFAAMFLPVVIAVALGAYFFTHNLSMVAAIFLVACADDMAVAIPLAVTASLGTAAKRGVIIKGGEWMEKLATMDILVLDKTGTITYGAVSVSGVHTEGMTEQEVLHFAGSAEKFSEHPLSRAVVKKAAELLGTVADPEKFAVVKGKGVSATVDGKLVFVGSPEYLIEKGIAPSPKLAESAHRAEEFGEMAFSVAVGTKLVGVITVADTPRAEAKSAIAGFSDIGVRRVIMLTGDHAAVARHVADALGIKEYQAQMKPEGKLEAIEKLVEHGVVGMVGDGINDAPALARADIGIAMGSAGTATAVEAADVIIMNDDLTRIAEVVRLSRRTMSVIHADGWIWFFSNFIGFAFVLTGVFGPALAAFYNFATDFLPLINSSRLFRSDEHEVQ